MPINILCNKLSLYEYRGNLYLSKDLRKINVLKKKVSVCGVKIRSVFEIRFTLLKFCLVVPQNKNP